MLKTLGQRLNDGDRQYHRKKLGMLEESVPVTQTKELDKEERQNVQTTTQLLEKRFKLDNLDISKKTEQGQELSKKQKEKRDEHERYRNPEKNSIHDVPSDPSLKAYSRK